MCELVQQWREKPTKKLEKELFKKYSKFANYFCRSYYKTHYYDDLKQECYIAMFRCFARCTDPESLEGYIAQACKNAITDYRKRKLSTVRVPSCNTKESKHHYKIIHMLEQDMPIEKISVDLDVSKHYVQILAGIGQPGQLLETIKSDEDVEKTVFLQQIQDKINALPKKLKTALTERLSGVTPLESKLTDHPACISSYANEGIKRVKARVWGL